MSSLQAICILLTFVIDSYKCLVNTYRKESGTNGEDIWKSDHMVPQQSEAYGTIQIGQVMSAEFDFTFHGRSSGFEENFFRVGHDANAGRYCAGEESRYPSFWLSHTNNYMLVKVPSGSTCSQQQPLDGYGLIYKGTSYHINIAFNRSSITVQITNNDNPVNGGWRIASDWDRTWTRNPTQKELIGNVVPVWWMSNKYSTTPYDIGNGTFTNITITSWIHTWQPTSNPTMFPTNNPTIMPSVSTNNPTATPTDNPSASTATPTKYPTTHPTHIPTNNPSTTPTNVPTVSPITPNPTNSPTITSNTTAPPTMTTVPPSYMPTHNPSISPTNNPSTTPTKYPTHIPTYTPSSSPTTYPSYNPSLSPTHNPSTPLIPTTSQPTTLPSHTPTLQPSGWPTISPTNLPTDTSVSPTRSPSTSPTTSTTKRPTFAWFPYTTNTTTQHPIGGTVVGDDEYYSNKMQSYEYIEITVFSTVITLCFCTVFCFLAYLTFKRRLNHLQRRKNLKPPNYELELAPKQIDILRAYSESNTNRKNDTNKHTHTHIQSRSSNTNTNTNIHRLAVNYLQSPKRTGQRYDQSLTSEQIPYDLPAYKDDSIPNSKSSMHLIKDCTPTPAVSPNDNYNNTLNKRYKSDIIVMDDMHDMDDMDNVGVAIDTNLTVKYRKPPKVKKKKKKHNMDTANANYTNDIEPYEEVLDGYVDGIYTHNNNNYEGEYNDTRQIFAGGGNGYEWIQRTLQRVDSQYHDEYLGNFYKHKVKDHRLADLLPEDWKELIPAIGPRNDFKRIWKTKFANSQNNNGHNSGQYSTGEFEYYDEDLDTNTNYTVPPSQDNYFQSEYTGTDDMADMPQELQCELLSALNSEPARDEELDMLPDIKVHDVHAQEADFRPMNDNRFLSVDSGDLVERDTPTTQFDDEEDSDETTSSEEEEEEDIDEELPQRRIEYGVHDNVAHDKSAVFTVSVSVSTAEREDEHGEDGNLTFDDLRNKYGGKNRSKKKEKQSVLSALSSAVSAQSNDTQSTYTDSYYEESSNLSEDEYKYKHRNKKLFNKNNPIPPPISEEPEEFDDDFGEFESETHLRYESNNNVHDAQMDHVDAHTNNALVSPGFTASHQYNIGHQVFAKPALKAGTNSSMSSASGMTLQSADSQDSQVSVGSDTTLSVPQPNEADEQELAKPLEEDDSEDEDTIGIPKFEAEVDSDDEEEYEEDYEDEDEDDEEEEEEEFEDEEYDDAKQYHHEYSDGKHYDENYEEEYEEEYEDEYEEEYEDEYGDEEAVLDIGLSESEHDEFMD